MSSPQEALIISPCPTVPLTGGNRARIRSFGKRLQADGWKVHLLVYDGSLRGGTNVTEETCRLMAKEWDRFEVVRASAKRLSLLSRVRRRVIDSRPYVRFVDRTGFVPFQYQAHDFACGNLSDRVREVVRERHYTLVVAEYAVYGSLLKICSPSSCLVVDTHDVLANRFARLHRDGVSPHFYSLSSYQESLGLSEADVVLAIQGNELEHFSQYPSVEALELNHLIESDPLPRRQGEGIVFGVVAGGNAINIQSVEKMMEAFAAKGLLQTATLMIAGPVCRCLSKVPEGVRLLGMVDSVRDFYGEIDVAINPSVAGTGLKIKSVEALAFGRPLVCLPPGIEGLPSEAPRHNCANMQMLADSCRQLATSESALTAARLESIAAFDQYRSSVARQWQEFCLAVQRHSNPPSQIP